MSRVDVRGIPCIHVQVAPSQREGVGESLVWSPRISMWTQVESTARVQDYFLTFGVAVDSATVAKIGECFPEAFRETRKTIETAFLGGYIMRAKFVGRYGFRY